MDDAGSKQHLSRIETLWPLLEQAHHGSAEAVIHFGQLNGLPSGFRDVSGDGRGAYNLAGTVSYGRYGYRDADSGSVLAYSLRFEFINSLAASYSVEDLHLLVNELRRKDQSFRLSYCFFG